MHIKLFPHGQGDGDMPTHYLVRPDYPGRQESMPDVLRGDPDITRALINSLETQWRFSAGVLSWHPDDTVTPEQEERVMDDFEAVAFAGLEPDQRNILWVRHSHAGHHELHFVIPRVELASGKSFNAFPPGWEKAFGVFRDLHNHKEQWARPDDPARARLYTPEHADLHRARLIRWGKNPGKDERVEVKEAIHAYMVAKLEQGLVHNREDVLTALQEAGLAINRAGKDYITVKDPDSGEKLRLKGGIYAKQWKFDFSGRAHPGQDRAGRPGDREPDPETVRELEQELVRIIESRAQYNRKRYPQQYRGIGEEPDLPLPEPGADLQPQVPVFHLFERGILLTTVCTCWGLITLYRYQITDLRQEIASLKEMKAVWDKDFPPIQRAFSGLELYQAEGKSYLLPPAGWTFREAGTVGKRNALEMVRK